MTTCGLDNVGEVCEIDGITYPLHGRISNQPAKHCYWSENDDDYTIHAIISQAALFMEKMELVREIHIGKKIIRSKLRIRFKIKEIRNPPVCLCTT